MIGLEIARLLSLYSSQINYTDIVGAVGDPCGSQLKFSLLGYFQMKTAIL